MFFVFTTYLKLNVQEGGAVGRGSKRRGKEEGAGREEKAYHRSHPICKIHGLSGRILMMCDGWNLIWYNLENNFEGNTHRRV